MATRKEIAQNQKILYDDAVANNMFQAAVPSFKEFQKRLEGQGYQKIVYDNYKKHNVKGKGFNSLNEFRGAFGGSFYADENKIGVSNRAQAISASAQQTMNNAGRYNRLKQRKQKQQKAFGRVNLGTHQTPYGGDANNVVKDDFAYNSETGKTGAYVTSDSETAYTQNDAEKKQNLLDKYGEEWNNAVDMGIVPSELDKADPDLSDTDVAMRQMERRQEWLNENQDRRSNELNESMHLQGSPFVASGGAVAPSSFNTAISNEANRLSDVEYGAYNTAKAYNQMLRTTLLQELKEQKQRNENAGWWKDKWNDVSNYFGAMFNTMLDPKLYSQGVMDAAISNNLLQVKKGMEDGTIKKGSNAGNAAQAMLGAIQQQQGEAAKQQQYGTKAYLYGDMSGRSLKFWGDFRLSGWRNVMTTGFTKAGEKVGEKMALGALGKWFTKNTGRVLGDMAGSAALAATNQLGSTYNNVIERYVGMNNENGGVTQDKNGDLKFNEGVSLGKAIKDGFGSATIENFSEMFGEYLPGAPKLLSKLGLSKVSSFFEKIGNNAYYKWLSNATNKSGIQGVMAEISEEEFGTALHAAWGDGDGSWSDFNVFTNPDAREKQIDTCLGMFYSVGFMQAPRTAVGAINAVRYFNIKHQVSKADKFGQMMFNDKWDEIKSKIDVTTNADLTKTVLDATRSDSMTAKQKGAVINYAMFLSKLRGFNQAADAKTKDKVEEGDTAPTLSNDLDDAYTEGHNADDSDKHNIQLEQNDKANELAAMLHITPEQLHDMADEDLETMTGQNDKLDQAIYDYQVSTAKYQGVMDGAQDEVDMAAHQAAMETDNMTDLSRGTVRKATIKATGGLEDYEVYIISGNIATHDDGSIDVGNSDDMIIYYDPTTGRKEHSDAMMFADLIEELPAADVKAQAINDAKENVIKKVAGIIDGTVEVGSQFSVTDADGTEHTYEVLADNGDGTAMITIDGNVPTELVKGENVQIPYSFADLQQMKDMEDQKRLEAAKDEREQMENERAAQQNQETEQTEEIQPSFDFTQILNDNGNVVLADVLGKDGNTKYPNSQLFLIRDSGAKAKVMELTSDGSLIPHAVNKKDVRTATTMTLDEYKQAMPATSMIEDNSGVDRGEIEVEAPTIEGETAAPAEETAAPESAETPATEQTPAVPAITLEDGTIVPMLEDGNPDFSKLTAEQTAELYDSQFGEDADSIVSGYVSDAKKALDKASNMTVKGKTFVEQKAAKDAKEKAIADAQAAYDSAIAIRDAYNERQLAKVEDTAEGRKELIEKARRKFARLKSAVKDDAEAVAQIYKETVGTLLHRLYDGTGIDVTDTIPLTAEEYVASNLGAHSLNYEGTETSKGVKQETGLSREDFGKTQLLAADGKGTTIDNLVHSLWENRPSNLDSLDTQDIRNAMLSVITSGFKASEAKNYIENLRIAQAENILEEQKKVADNAAFAEEQKAKQEEEDKKAEENEKINEQNKFPDKLREGSKAIEVHEDATDEKPLGEQRTKSPFLVRENGKQQTETESDADVEKNKVDDMKVVDNIVGEKTRKTLEKIAKIMGANIQWLYSNKQFNGKFDEKTNTIYLTLDSSIIEGVQFIFGHEMTHEMRTKNPASYDELKTLVKDMMGEDAFNSETDKMQIRYKKGGARYWNDRNAIEEEVVADQLGIWIRDANYAHTLLLKMSHPLLARLHEIVNSFLMALHGTEFSDDMRLILRSIEQAYVKTAKGEITNSETGEDVSFSLRQKPEPKKKGVGYKVFVLKDGKLYPPMVANPDGAATPVGVWLDADAAPIAGESKTGRPQVKQGGKGTQGGSGKLAYRPGWHLGVVPYAIQFNRKDAEGNKTLFPKNFVFAEVEYAADVDYQEEARQEGINPSGKYQHSLAGLKHLPTDGYYMYRTNPNPETDPWVITGAMKVNRILTRAEQADLVSKAGREPQQIQEGDIVTDDVVNSINQEIADAPKFSLKVYHGSGADFTEFDFDHMGEGAGSQAFGWGGYVTSSEEIGKSYANLSRDYGSRNMYKGDVPLTKLEKAALSSYIENNKNHERTIKDGVAGLIERQKALIAKHPNNPLSNSIKKRIEVLEGAMPKLDSISWDDFVPSGKNLYEVDIPEDNGSNYLDWDAPITDELIDKVAKVLPSLRSYDISDLKKDRAFDNFYKTISMRSVTDDASFNDDKAASKLLSSLGYTGIKYKAGRNFGGAEEGDTNYVIFKPEDMRITEHTKFSLRLKSAIEETETNPSDAQKESGNYKKGHIKFGGYDYTIENPKGSTRSGKDADGKEWKVTMHDTYGYIRGKFGKDGDHLDMFINDKADLDNWNGDVFVVDQVNPDGSFDEHKVMYGYDSMNDAQKAYLANYSDGWKGLGNITGASKDEFDKWLDTSKRKLKPFADYAKVKFSQAQSVNNDEPKTFEEFLNHPSLKFSIKNEEQRKAAEDAYEYASKLRPNKYAQYALVDMSNPSNSPEYYEKKVLADRWRRFYNKAVHNELDDVYKDAWGNYKLFDLDRPFADQVNEVKGDVPSEFNAPDVTANKNADNESGAEYHEYKQGGLSSVTYEDRYKAFKQREANREKTAGLRKERKEVEDSYNSKSKERIEYNKQLMKEYMDKHGLSSENDIPYDVWDDLRSKSFEKYQDELDSLFNKYKDLDRQIKAVAEPRFSLKDEKTMFGMHNISVDKLRKAIKQGGFAAPSMGVVDSKNGIYSDYGEITLIPKAEKLAKRTGKNAGTFTADAWTPTYPQVERIMNKQGEKAFNTDMNVKLGDVDNGIYSNVRESWKGYLSSGDVRDGLYWHYLFDKGMNPETIYQNGKYDNDITNEVMRISDNGNKTDYTDKEVAELIQLMNKATGKDNDVDAQREKLKARIASAEKQGNHLLVALKKKRLEELEGVENFYIAADFVNDVVRNNRKNGKVDVHDTMDAAKEKVENDKKLSDDFPSWLDKKTEEYGVEEMLYNGTTPSGKPKYIPNTIENAVKLMKKQGVAGGYTAFGSELGVFIAKNSPEVNTLAAMKNAKDKLIPFGDERHNQIKDKITKEFLELSDEIRVGSNNRYAFDDSGVSRMVELTDHKGNEKEYLKKAYNVEVSDEWMDRYNKLLDTIKKDYKVFYFETKFMRPYGLDEFEKAIVPSDTPSDVVDALKKAGLDVSSYERGNAEDRQKVTMDAINSSDNIRFSLAGERGAAASDKAEERTFRMDNLSVAKDMEKNKKKAKAIKTATGWERGADGKWRYEMPDVVLRDPKEWINKKTLTLSDIVEKPNDLFKEYPELFDAYPELKNVKIQKGRAKMGGPYYDNTITLNLGYIREAIKSGWDTYYKTSTRLLKRSLVHEIQHYIQEKEGFAQGGNSEMIVDKNALDAIAKLRAEKDAVAKEFYAMSPEEQQRKKYEINDRYNDLTKQIERLEKSSRIGYDGYKRLSGEVEARNVSARLNMTPEERRKSLAESTEDVARKDQIFLGVGDVSFSLRDMADGKESGAADMAEDLKSLNTPDEVDDAIKTAIDDMPSGWKMANKKMIHIAQALGENRKAEIDGEEPKFSLKDGSLIKAGTYFSGGGLVEEGLKGIIDPVVAVEYDEKISGVYRNNFGQHIVTADVRDVDPKELVKQIDGEVEYFHASPVCKNYSQAKSNHAEVELDKETAASTAEFINAIKPKVVTIENVKGYKDSDAMKTITDALDANGYTWDADVYNAADYGGYTNRERLIVRAVRDGKLPEKPKKMAHKSGWYEAVADIIPTLTEKKNGVAPWMDVRLKADGIDWRNIDKPLYVMGSAYADGKIPHAFADELLPTLRTKSGDVIVMPDGKVYRAMGRVLARVSGVSDDYKMPFSENLSHTIIGNGIPTQLTEHVIAPLLTGSDPKFSIRTYHGTGASFDKFDLSHALEGEGSESFGHGVYVTNSSKIGREYAQRAKNRKMEDLYKNMRYPDGVKGDIFKRRVFGEMVNDVATGGSVESAKEFAKKRVGADANDIQRTLENLKDREKGTEYEQNLKDRLAEYKEGLKWIDSLDEDYLTQGNANRYDVDIPDDNGSNYLDWEGTIPDSLDKQKVAEDAYKVVSDNQGFNDFKATPLNDFIAHTLKTYVNTTDVAGRVEKLKSDIKDVIENYVADDDVLALNEYLKDATPDDVLATIWYNDLVRDIKDADLGEELYRKLSTYVGDNAASQILSDNGFVGIKYPAGLIHGGAEEGDYNYVIFDENNANIVGNTRFSLRYDKFEHDLNQWKKDNNLPKDAQRPTIPQRNAGESAVDFLRRVDEYRKQMALWKTAPTYEQHLLSDDTALGEFNRELQRGSVLKRIAFQDSMLAIRKAQEAIMKEVGVDRLNMAEDAYTAENRSHGKGKNEFEEYNNEFLQPLRKAYHQMKKILGDSYDNVRIYMMSKHGLERDAQMAFKKSLDADFEDVAQRSAAYRAYKGDMNRITNDSDLEFGRVDFNTWRQRDNALRTKFSPSFMDYRYDKNGIAYDYSGLSALFGGSDFEEAAHKLVRDIESSHVAEVQDLWNATNAATKKILRDGYKAGMMSKDTYQYVRDMYRHYIPLRGWDGTTADQVWDYVGGGKGAFNQTLKTAHGRTSIADDPIAYIENMAESGILLNNKNWVKQHLMLLAQNHPTSLLTLSKAWYVKSTDANGNEEWIPATPQITSQMNSNQVKAAIDAFEQKMEQMAQTGDATQKRDGLNIAYPQTHSEEREHEVRVMKDGEEYVIYVNGDPQLAQAMNNTRAHRVREIQSGKLDRAAAWLGRKMAAAYTSLSPLFVPSNYFRDLTMTLASTAIREDAKYNYLLRKNLATSWNLGFMLKDYQNGKLREKVSNGNATPKEQMFYDFMMNGGETGFVSSLDVEDLKKKFKNDLKDLDRWKTNPVKVGHTIMDGIEFLNRAIEDSNRFAVYMTSIQYGRSIDEAVNDAKDVTLNFNRKGTGEYGWQMIRNLYLFINPSVQSLQTLGALAKHHPFKFTAVTASWLASGVLVPIVNAALMSLLGGDDDKDKYWQFTKWDRRNNLIMWVPFTHEYVKIPLAQEFRAFYGVGDMIASKMMGVELAEESWSQYAEDLLGQVVDMLPLDPTGYDGNIAVSLMPNAIRPVFELAFNVDFTGKPLFKETEYNKYDPNFTKAYVGTPDWLVRASKMVNSIGNDYPDVQQNSIDAFGDPRYNLNNPAVVDHVLSSYLGGAYTMGSQVLGVLTKSLNDPKEIKVADIPLFSKFVSNPDDRPVTKKQGDEFWDMKENHDRAANTLSKLKKQAKVDGDYSMLERFYGSEEYKQYKQDDVKVKKYEEDKKKERAEESGEEYRPHKLNAEDIYKAHATPKDDFEDLKLKQLYTKLNGFKSAYDLLVDTAPSQSDGYYNTNKAAIDAIDEISLDKQEISELKKGFLDDGKDAYNAEDMKQIRELRKKILVVLEKANKVVVANQKAKTEK
jgi:site-specific DNA-cytosine methylase